MLIHLHCRVDTDIISLSSLRNCGEQASRLLGCTTGAGGTGATARKNPKKKDSKEFLALVGAIPSGATTKHRQNIQGKRALEKTYQSPFTEKMLNGEIREAIGHIS